MMYFVNDTATTEIYTLSLLDALPILDLPHQPAGRGGHGRARAEAGRGSPGDRPASGGGRPGRAPAHRRADADRKSTRLNSSHANISYAVFFFKKKKIICRIFFFTLDY